MTPVVIPPPPVSSEVEALTLDGLALNDGATLMLLSLSMPPPAKKPEWISGADSDGAILGRDPLYENRVIEARVAVLPQASKNAAMAHIGSVLDKLQECSRQPNGLGLTWDPADSTYTPITFRCLAGEITDLPIDWEHGWLVRSPEFTVRLTCLPFGHGVEALLASVTSTLPLISLEVAGVAGDVPALGRLVFTDGASQSRRWMAWGMESRHYNAATSLILDSTGMVTTGYAGVTGTRAGAYSGATNNVITATLRTQVQAICGLGNLAHVGAFRPHLRFYASATTMAVRLTYQSLDGPMRSLSYRVPVVAGWNLVDLGLITIPEFVVGAQRWTGRVEALSTAAGGETFAVDVLFPMPAQAFGRARANYAYQAGTMVAYDDFVGMTALSFLNGRIAPVGGTWATSGAAVDWQATGTLPTEIVRIDTGTRHGILGAAQTNMEVSVLVQLEETASGVIARWTNSSNHVYLQASSVVAPGPRSTTLRLVAVVAGVETVLAISAARPDLTTGDFYTLSLVCYASGQTHGELRKGAATVLAVAGRSTTLATGGTLASGQPGIVDYEAVGDGGARAYSDYYVAIPAAEPIACYSGQSIEFRHDGTLREDATGTYAGPPPEAINPSGFTLPNAGGPGRKARVAVMARRDDIDTSADDHIADAGTIEVWGQPRYLAIPR